jgi:regulator of sigma E protease
MIITIIVFIFVLSFLVLIHEFGHFIVAKKFGIKVEEFGFGLPPRIFGKKFGETTYSLNLLPIGGFVRLFGEEEEQAGKDKSRSFMNKSTRVRALVVIAGVTMNFLVAILVISYIFTQGVFVPTKRLHIEAVSPESPASVAGLKPMDVILSMVSGKDTKFITSSQDLISFTDLHLDKKTEMQIVRCVPGKKSSSEIPCNKGFGPEKFTVIVTPRKNSPKGQGPIGIVISNLEQRKYSIIEAPFYGTKEVISLSGAMVSALGQLVFRLVTMAKVPSDIAGPIGVAQITGQAVKLGPEAVLQLLGFLSLNLAIVNILPIPALDGGRLLFIIVEAIFGKKVRPSFEQKAHQIGMVLLLTLILLITINDVRKIIDSSSLLHLMRGVFK